jgi:hypothetical protein
MFFGPPVEDRRRLAAVNMPRVHRVIEIPVPSCAYDQRCVREELWLIEVHVLPSVISKLKFVVRIIRPELCRKCFCFVPTDVFGSQRVTPGICRRQLFWVYNYEPSDARHREL